MPEPDLGVLVVAQAPERAARLAQAVTEQGLRLAGQAGGAGQAVDLCRSLDPDLVLLAAGPAEEGLETLRQIALRAPRAVVLLAPGADQAFITQARAAGAQACLIEPIGQGVLGPVLELAHQSFAKERDLAQEVAGLREDLRQRKLTEQAKGLIMQGLGLGYAEAGARLAQQAASQGQSPLDAAQALISRAASPDRPRR